MQDEKLVKLTKEERVRNNRLIGEAYLKRYAECYKTHELSPMPDSLRFHPDAVEIVQNFPAQPYHKEDEKVYRHLMNEAMMFLKGEPCNGPGIPDWRALPEKSVVVADENTCMVLVWFQGTLKDGTVVDSWETDYWSFDEYGRITCHFLYGEGVTYDQLITGASGMSSVETYKLLHDLDVQQGNC